MRFPLSLCQPGDGSELLDRTPAARDEWWSRNDALRRVPRYSIAAIPQESRISPLLSFPHRWLSLGDPLNDGQLLWRDTVMSSSGLLAFANADHWGVAMSLGKAFPLLSPWIVDEPPRAEMLLAAIDVIAADLSHQGRQDLVPKPWGAGFGLGSTSMPEYIVRVFVRPLAAAGLALAFSLPAATAVAEGDLELAHHLGPLGEQRLQGLVDRFSKDRGLSMKLVRYETGRPTFNGLA